VGAGLGYGGSYLSPILPPLWVRSCTKVDDLECISRTAQATVDFLGVSRVLLIGFRCLCSLLARAEFVIFCNFTATVTFIRLNTYI